MLWLIMLRIALVAGCFFLVIGSIVALAMHCVFSPLDKLWKRYYKEPHNGI